MMSDRQVRCETPEFAFKTTSWWRQFDFGDGGVHLNMFSPGVFLCVPSGVFIGMLVGIDYGTNREDRWGRGGWQSWIPGGGCTLGEARNSHRYQTHASGRERIAGCAPTGWVRFKSPEPTGLVRIDYRRYAARGPDTQGQASWQVGSS